MRKVRLISIVLVLAILLLGGTLAIMRHTAPSPPPLTEAPPPVTPPPKPAVPPKPSPIPPAPLLPEQKEPVKMGVLTGRVIDSNAASVADALVRLADDRYYSDSIVPGRPRPRALITTTNDLGEFRFEGVTHGRKFLGANHPDHPPGTADPFLFEGDTDKIIRLPAPVILTGTVTPPDAVVHARFRFPGEASIFATATGRGNPEEGGTYLIDRIPSRTPFQVQVEAPEYLPQNHGPYRYDAGEVRVDFVLERGAELVGTVSDLSGKPVAGAFVSLGDKRTTTDENGGYRIPGLDKRRGLPLAVSKPGHVHLTIDNIPPGRRDITLPRGVKVSGRVEGGGGMYVCYSIGNTRMRTPVGKSGEFSLSTFPPGRTRLDVETSDRRIVTSIDLQGLEGGALTDVVIRVP